MAIYSIPSSDTPYVSCKKSWDPMQTFGILNHGYGSCITCIGYAPSKRRRCQNPIRADNRQFVMRTLDEIAKLPLDSPAIKSKLRTIAGPMLCAPRHQDQYEDVVGRWYNDLRKIKLQRKNYDGSDDEEDVKIKQEEDGYASFNAWYESYYGKSQQRNRTEGVKTEVKQPKTKVEGVEEEETKKNRQQAREEKRREQEKKEQERQRREREKEQRERKAREEKERQERQEREDWKKSWTRYQSRWSTPKENASETQRNNIRDSISWPVKSGCYKDITRSEIKKFYDKAPNLDRKSPEMIKFVRDERLKWHPDKAAKLLRGQIVTEADKLILTMITTVLNDLMEKIRA